MKIDAEKCVGCGICLDYCNVGAISIKDQKAVIDGNVCVECWLCYRNHVCPNDCFEPTALETPADVFKHVLSDPTETSAERASLAEEPRKPRPMTSRVVSTRTATAFASTWGGRASAQACGMSKRWQWRWQPPESALQARRKLHFPPSWRTCAPGKSATNI